MKTLLSYAASASGALFLGCLGCAALALRLNDPLASQNEMTVAGYALGAFVIARALRWAVSVDEKRIR